MKQERVELHCHSSFSAFDGVASPEELMAYAQALGQTALAITDHGVIDAFSTMMEAYKELQVKPSKFNLIYGVEGYFLIPQCERRASAPHISILVQNQVGLQNLYYLTALSKSQEYFKRYPRIPKAALEEYRSGLMIGSACSSGMLYQAVLRQENFSKLCEMAAFYDYLEVQPIGNDQYLLEQGVVSSASELQQIIRTIIDIGRHMGKTVVATGDAHFLRETDAPRRAVLMQKCGYDISQQQPPLHFRSTVDMLNAFSFLGQTLSYQIVVENTNAIANRCQGVAINTVE